MKSFDFFQKTVRSRFHGKPIHRTDDSSDDESDNLEVSAYEAGTSEIDSDSHESSSDQSYVDMNTTQDDDDMSETDDRTKQPPGPAQNDWLNNIIATSSRYIPFHR